MFPAELEDEEAVISQYIMFLTTQQLTHRLFENLFDEYVWSFSVQKPYTRVLIKPLGPKDSTEQAVLIS